MCKIQAPRNEYVCRALGNRDTGPSAENNEIKDPKTLIDHSRCYGCSIHLLLTNRRK